MLDDTTQPAAADKPHLEWDAGEGCRVGRDPRKITAEQWAELGIEDRPLLRIIREKCLDCCVGHEADVRRCGMIDCALWPYRMGVNPLRRRELTEDQRAELVQRGKRLAASRLGSQDD